MSNMNEYTDDQLLEKYREDHDLKVIGELFKRHQHIVFGICLKYLRDRSAAEDALMEIFEELIKALQTADIRSFKPWLGTVSRNYLHRKYKRDSKVRTLSYEDNVNEIDTPFMELSEDGTPIHESAEIEAMESWIQSHGVLGWVVYVLLIIVLTSLFVPFNVLAMAGGAMFGIHLGIALTFIAVVSTAVVNYVIADKLLRSKIDNWLKRSRKLLAIQQAVQRKGLRLQLLLRMSPVSAVTVNDRPEFIRKISTSTNREMTAVTAGTTNR